MDVQHLLDLEEIRQLKYRWSWALETSAPDDLADLFTEDGWIETGPWGRMEGRDAIRRGYGRAYRHAPPFRNMHCVTNPRITIDGDDAAGTWYLLDCDTSGDVEGPALRILAVYDETYRRVGGAWRMASVTLDYKWAAHVGHVGPDNPMTIPPHQRRARS
ncbi:MAG: nuclear transport factor 2 family protein [Ilumatobacteraceae bacterium]